MGKKYKVIILLFLTAFFLPAGSQATLEDVYYHRVRAGETLWGISRTYNVSVAAIRSANKQLSHTDIIQPGHMIFIPRARGILLVEPLTARTEGILRVGTSTRWEYIVIHHSATTVGSARLFNKYHRERGFSLGYHFVIGNGTDNSADGQIEVGHRWRNQLDGAHTRGNANRVGIGICLVGNFENSVPTRRQLEALLSLTTQLAYRYNIPLENIRGHKDFVNNTTKCPGKNFPWLEFKRGLRERGIN